MSSLATRRLIDAAATLDPADRALLNLWVNRGLDDERLTGMTGMSTEALQRRRAKIIAGLSVQLGLPEQEIRTALAQISPDDEALGPAAAGAEVNGVAGASTSANGVVADDAAAHPEPAGGDGARRRRRGPVTGLAALILLVAVVIVLIATGGSSPRPSPTAHRAAGAPTTTAAPTPAAPASPHPTGGPVPAPLAGLPGGLAHASGSVRLSGPVKHLKLNVRVRGLPTAHGGHYEVWLYNSVLDSRPLGRLRNGHRALIARLPGNARRFHWIDISFQPVGIVNHSGESELRALNPAHTSMARLRKRSARRGHRLRQATKVSDALPSAGHGARHRAHHAGRHAARHRARHRARPGRRAARAHRLKRSARGSSAARTSK